MSGNEALSRMVRRRATGPLVNHKPVSRLMRENKLQSRIRRRFRVVATDSKHAHPVAQNVLAREFEADAPNQKWLTDITCVRRRRACCITRIVVHSTPPPLTAISSRRAASSCR